MPRSVTLAVVLFAAGLVINYAVEVALMLPNLGADQGHTAIHAFKMFVIAAVTVVPLLTWPFWAPQLLFLWPTYYGKNWARYLLFFSVVPVWCFYLWFYAGFQTFSFAHVTREWTFWANAAAALSQLAAMILFWVPDSTFFFTGYRRR